MYNRLEMWLKGFRSGHTYPGLINHQGVNHDEYFVKLNRGNEVVVKQMQIVNDVIPDDTAVMVVYENGRFYMQVPVWLL